MRPYTLLSFVTLALPACAATAPAEPGDEAAPIESQRASFCAPTARPATYSDPTAVGRRVSATLADLAAMGPKRAGTPQDRVAGAYVRRRFERLGLARVHDEEFHFPRFELGASSLAVSIDGAGRAMGHQVFYYSGAGHVDADIVDVGVGREANYAGKNVAGKIVLVTRDPFFHRISQAKLVAAHGGAAMLYVSASPNNLVQVGTVAAAEDGLGPVPTVTVGADDGKAIIDALAAGKTAHAVVDVSASIGDGVGRNVIGELPGTDPSGAYLVVGAHYDTWYAGSTDNGTGVASLLEQAEALARGPRRRLGVVFVGYDAEEVGLFGGYDYLRKHVIHRNEPMLAFVNLEMPGAGPADPKQIRVVAQTVGGPIDGAQTTAGLHALYTTTFDMETVPKLFGGLVPTDIQGMYWSGLQGTTTYCATDYYHTTEDTPDKIDIGFLANATMGLERTLDELDKAPIASFQVHDPSVWAPDFQANLSGPGDASVQVVVKDAAGTVQPGATVTVWVDTHDFTRAFKSVVVADAAGAATVTIPRSRLDHRAWLHVTTGKAYPLSERIIPIR